MLSCQFNQIFPTLQTHADNDLPVYFNFSFKNKRLSNKTISRKNYHYQPNRWKIDLERIWLDLFRIARMVITDVDCKEFYLLFYNTKIINK